MEVNCEYSDDIVAYKCFIEGTDISNPNLITKFLGEHLRNKSDDDVVALTFESCSIKSFPRHLMKFFPNLRVIEIISCDLTEITKEDLKFYPYLKYLGVVKNRLTHLSSDLFEYTPYIQFIDFSGNLINTIGPRIFDPLTIIREINLIHNKNISKFYEVGMSGSNLDKLIDFIKKHCRPMESLKEIAASKMMESINKKNAAKLFFYGSRFDHYGMKRMAFQYMKFEMFPWLDERMFNDESGNLMKMIGMKSC